MTFVILFSLALFLAYAVNRHLVTDLFIALCALFFDSFNARTSSQITDIILLIAFALMRFGLFCLFRYFWQIAITALIIGIIAAIFLTPETGIKNNDSPKLAFPTLDNVRGG